MPGYWYTNIVGQLQQVRVVLHEGRRRGSRDSPEKLF